MVSAPEVRARWKQGALWQVVTQHKRIICLLAGAFLFRLSFGLCSPFWQDDEKQIYLIGLKFYATKAWPYFGPDVAPQVQIPGALQSLLVALPLFLLPIPEAPLILLNLISFFALCWFAWYCCRRLPGAPRWFIWTYLMTCPWTLNFSTHVVNPSYVLAGGIGFFIGALETLPQTSRNLVKPIWANLMMGASLVSLMQLHLSWVVLVPFAVVSVYFQLRSKGTRAIGDLLWFLLGAALPAGLLVPTYIRYGLAEGAGGTISTVGFNATNLRGIIDLPQGILARFLSFASFEMPRFLGNNSATRLRFLMEQWWLAPIIVFLSLVGILQPITLIVLWFRKRPQQDDWKAIRYLVLFSVLLLYVLFAFSSKAPVSHTFYVMLPVAMLYGFYCWTDFLRETRWQKLARLVLVCGVIFHVGLAIHNYSRVSLYTNRAGPLRAIELKDPTVLGERRAGSRY